MRIDRATVTERTMRNLIASGAVTSDLRRVAIEQKEPR
jgi:hypothetical protein